jgi:hypothetical protein
MFDLLSGHSYKPLIRWGQQSTSRYKTVKSYYRCNVPANMLASHGKGASQNFKYNKSLIACKHSHCRKLRSLMVLKGFRRLNRRTRIVLISLM